MQKGNKDRFVDQVGMLKVESGCGDEQVAGLDEQRPPVVKPHQRSAFDGNDTGYIKELGGSKILRTEYAKNRMASVKALHRQEAIKTHRFDSVNVTDQKALIVASDRVAQENQPRFFGQEVLDPGGSNQL